MRHNAHENYPCPSRRGFFLLTERPVRQPPDILRITKAPGRQKSPVLFIYRRFACPPVFNCLFSPLFHSSRNCTFLIHDRLSRSGTPMFSICFSFLKADGFYLGITQSAVVIAAFTGHVCAACVGADSRRCRADDACGKCRPERFICRAFVVYCRRGIGTKEQITNGIQCVPADPFRHGAARGLFELLGGELAIGLRLFLEKCFQFFIGVSTPPAFTKSSTLLFFAASASCFFSSSLAAISSKSSSRFSWFCPPVMLFYIIEAYFVRGVLHSLPSFSPRSPDSLSVPALMLHDLCGVFDILHLCFEFFVIHSLCYELPCGFL